jgi:hypothetical protein
MKKLFLFFVLSMLTAYTQTDSTKMCSWTKAGVVGFNINQVSLNNWSAGGDNTVAWTFNGNFGLGYQTGMWKLDNNLKFAFGRTKQGSDAYRTNDNELYLEDILAYDIKWTVNPFFSNTVRTTITDGYNYNVVPFVRIAGFFDPGYVTQSLGFTYDRNVNIQTRLGIALQEVFTNKFTQYTDDPTTAKIERFKLETGIESVTKGQLIFDDNVLLNSELRLFSRFNSLSVWDVRWDNTITAKISKYFNVNLNVLVLYEKDLSLKTQLKEGLQFGINYVLF